MVRAALLPHNLPQLQNLIKRDPQSYREEFFQQYFHFKASIAILADSTTTVADEQLNALITFISHVCNLYPESKAEFPALITGLLGSDEVAASLINSNLRKTLVQALLLLRKHDTIPLAPVLELFFRLLRIQDKQLRLILYISIIGEIKRANKPHRNNALNKSLQNFCYSKLAASGKSVNSAKSHTTTDEQTISSMHQTIQIVIELYRKRIWDDSRTVNVIADAATREISPKIMTTALNFFIGRFRGKSLMPQPGDHSDEEGDPSTAVEEQSKYQTMLFRSQLTGSKRSSEKKLKKQLDAVHRKELKAQKIVEGEGETSGTFSPMHLLNDPQGFAERLYLILKKSNDPFETKLLLMNVISRVIGTHKLILLEFYPFLQRYIQPHQKEVTHILAFAAQACHELVPPDAAAPLVSAIADNFVAEYCAAPVIAAGLNGLTALCRRCPEAMDGDLLTNLISTFKGYSDKGVVMAVRGLISLYREVDPTMLHRRERGKQVSLSMAANPSAHIPKKYGQTNILDASMRQNNTIQNSIDDDIDDRSSQHFEECHSSELVDDFSSDIDDSQERDVDWPDKVEFQNDTDDDFENEIDSDLESETLSKKGLELKDRSKVKLNDIVKLATEQPLTEKQMALLRRRMAGLDQVLPSNSDSEDNEDMISNDRDDFIDPKSLESSKKSRQDYESRMASIKEGREGRLKYGSRMGKHNAKASVSNSIKSKKTKNPIMLAHKPSVRAKKRRSLKEMQAATQSHAKRQKMKK